MIPSIDYKMMVSAIEFYKLRGFNYIEVPWLVSPSSINVTKPKKCRPLTTVLGDLVGSGEQSFLEMRDELCPGRLYQCVTPCFRDDVKDEYHFNWFMKNELIHPLWKTDDPEKALSHMIDKASTFFMLYIPSYSAYLQRVKTDIGVDLTLRGIELGSYGVREYHGFRWVYGTGLALPRFSQVLKLNEEKTEEENKKSS